MNLTLGDIWELMENSEAQRERIAGQIHHFLSTPETPLFTVILVWLFILPILIAIVLTVKNKTSVKAQFLLLLFFWGTYWFVEDWATSVVYDKWAEVEQREQISLQKELK